MSRDEPEDVARLRAAFAAVEGDVREHLGAERIFDAVHGTLDLEDRHAVVDELVMTSDAAEAWRLARELTPDPPARWFELVRRWQSLAAAAGVLLTLGVGWQLSGPPTTTTGSVYRNVDPRSITSALRSDRTLSRAQPVLRWTGVPGARYRVRVLTPALEVLEISPELDAAQYSLSEATMRRVDAGSDILWQVEGRMFGGTVIESSTFRVRVD